MAVSSNQKKTHHNEKKKVYRKKIVVDSFDKEFPQLQNQISISINYQPSQNTWLSIVSEGEQEAKKLPNQWVTIIEVLQYNYN